MNFSLSNFRNFQSKTDFQLNPLTVLVGPNSSGKSSIIKSLLLLKENFKKDLNFSLDTNIGDLKLGEFKNTLYHKNKEQSFKLPLTIFNKEFS